MRYSSQSTSCRDEWRGSRSRLPRSSEQNESWRDAWKEDYRDERKSPYRSETSKAFLYLVKKETPRSSLEDTFNRLVEVWHKETAIHSPLIKKVTHKSYQRIIGMGPDAIPLVLKEMKRRPGHWFWALDALTQGQSPPQDWKTLEQATQAWIKWGEDKGYL